MFKVIVYFAVALTAISMLLADPKEGPAALLMVLIVSGLSLFIFRRYTDEKEFITYIFLSALCVRLIFGIIVHIYDMRVFTGGDAIGYDLGATLFIDYWQGNVDPSNPELIRLMSLRGAGWGMRYLVAVIYVVFDRNIFVAQSFCGVIGAATVPLTYFCTEQIFHNKRVARTAAICIAFFPAFIIWSSQLLKDGLIVFLLVLIVILVIQLQKQFTWTGLLILSLSLFGILSLRFYIFYVAVVMVAGSFFIGLSNSIGSVIQRTAILLLVAGVLVYLGVLQTTTADLETYGSLERAQMSRGSLADTGDSGFGRDEDISTVRGALAALPKGFAYLMFAPFPWEVSNLRQSITLPDVLLWWATMPFLIYGLWYSLKNKLRACLPILLFTFMLTVSYSIFQGNVGTAYRQRTQIQVFLFMFIAVGWGLLRERMEDNKTVELNRKREMAAKLQARLQQTRQIH